MKCKKCGRLHGQGYFDPNTGEEIYDSCLGELPGVISACCGHGGEGHIVFSNGTRIGFTNLTVTHNHTDKEKAEGYYQWRLAQAEKRRT